MAADVLKQQANWKYQVLRDHLLTLQHLQTNGPAPMLYNLEQPEASEVADAAALLYSEDGELMRLERRNGRQLAVKAKNPPVTTVRQPRVTRNDAECHACGRKGHS